MEVLALLIYPLCMLITAVSAWVYMHIKGEDTPIVKRDIIPLSIMWPATVILLIIMWAQYLLRTNTDEEKRRIHIKKLKKKKMNVEAAIVIEEKTGLLTGKPILFPKLKNWDYARRLVENIINDEVACCAISVNSRGYLPSNKVLTVHSIQFVYRSDKTNEVLAVETYENHKGPSTFMCNREYL